MKKIMEDILLGDKTRESLAKTYGRSLSTVYLWYKELGLSGDLVDLREDCDITTISRETRGDIRSKEGKIPEDSVKEILSWGAVRKSINLREDARKGIKELIKREQMLVEQMRKEQKEIEELIKRKQEEWRNRPRVWVPKAVELDEEELKNRVLNCVKTGKFNVKTIAWMFRLPMLKVDRWAKEAGYKIPKYFTYDGSW
jgi:hypothetical protein